MRQKGISNLEGGLILNPYRGLENMSVHGVGQNVMTPYVLWKAGLSLKNHRKYPAV